MSLESVQTIIDRAVTEPEYQELLFSEPDKALEGYDLTEEEAAALKELEREKFDAVVGDLVARISRTGLGLTEGERREIQHALAQTLDAEVGIAIDAHDEIPLPDPPKPALSDLLRTDQKKD